MSTPNSATAPAVRTSNFNLSTSRTFSTLPGLIVPFYHTTTLPGDKFFVKISQGVETLPLQSPLYSTFRSRVAVFWLSWRAVSPKLHFNSGSIDPRTVMLPQFLPSPRVVVDGDDNFVTPNSDGIYADRVVAPQSLFNFLYYPTQYPLWVKSSASSSTSPDETDLSAYNAVAYRSGIPYFMYHSIFYHWYANWQAPYAPVLNAFPSLNSYGFGSILLDDIRSWLMRVALNDSAPLNLALSANSLYPAQPAWAYCNIPYGGLLCCTHKPDMLTAFISSASRNAIQQSSRIDTSSGSFSIDSFISTEKIKKYLELGFFGASGYRDWVYAQFGVTPPADCGVPSCLAFTDMYLDFQTIVANSSEGLGDLASRGRAFSKAPLHRFNFTEYGTLMMLHTLVPRVSYAPSLCLVDQVQSLSDLPSPATQNIAWQPLLRGQLSLLPRLDVDGPDLVGVVDNSSLQSVVGYQPAWSEYMSDVDRSFGVLEPGQNLSHWLLGRGFRHHVAAAAGVPESYTFDPTTYVLATDYMTPFVDNSTSATNFFIQVNLQIRARRPLSKKAVPTL